MTVTEEDLQVFTEHVRDTMFRCSESHRWPDEFADLWPNITPQYRFQHTLHVRRFCERLRAEQGGDLEVLRVAAIFHDISHFCAPYGDHGRVSAEMARDYLRAHRSGSGVPYGPAFIDKVFLTIDDHASDKSDAYYLSEAPLESMILIEADLADKLGPSGLVSHLLLSGYNRRFWRATNEALEQYVIGRGERALANDGLRYRLTPAGRRLIEERLAWTKRLLEQIRADVACIF